MKSWEGICTFKVLKSGWYKCNQTGEKTKYPKRYRYRYLRERQLRQVGPEMTKTSAPALVSAPRYTPPVPAAVSPPMVTPTSPRYETGYTYCPGRCRRLFFVGLAVKVGTEVVCDVCNTKFKLTAPPVPPRRDDYI